MSEDNPLVPVSSFGCSLRESEIVAAIVMNSLFTKPQTDESPEEGEVFFALIAYEDSLTRNRAMQICDRLMEKFWMDMEFDLSWWRFDFLRDAGIVKAAANAAARSDLILVSAHAGRELPSHVQKWIETWVPRRELGNGVLVAMIGTSEDQLRGLTPIHVYLREAAQRANLDYLPQVVDAPLNELNTSIETISKRAEKVTSLLDGILHRPTIPTRWGINE